MLRPPANPHAPAGAFDSSGAGAEATRLTAAGPGLSVLDMPSLDRLRELDPTGQNRLLERVFAAFDNSVNKLRPQLQAAREAGDLVQIRHVAHTLKSSSASLGALRLAEVCADVETLARQGEAGPLPPRLDALGAELDVALAELRRLLGARP